MACEGGVVQRAVVGVGCDGIQQAVTDVWWVLQTPDPACCDVRE